MARNAHFTPMGGGGSLLENAPAKIASVPIPNPEIHTTGKMHFQLNVCAEDSVLESMRYGPLYLTGMRAARCSHTSRDSSIGKFSILLSSS